MKLNKGYDTKSLTFAKQMKGRRLFSVLIYEHAHIACYKL